MELLAGGIGAIVYLVCPLLCCLFFLLVIGGGIFLVLKRGKSASSDEVDSDAVDERPSVASLHSDEEEPTVVASVADFAAAGFADMAPDPEPAAPKKPKAGQTIIAFDLDDFDDDDED